MKESRIVEIKIGFDVDDEEIKYIKSDFMDKSREFKEPVEYTVQLIQMALEKFIRDHIGLQCPECGIEIQEGWGFCPKCGYSFED
jgi:hypothetical protein